MFITWWIWQCELRMIAIIAAVIIMLKLCYVRLFCVMLCYVMLCYDLILVMGGGLLGWSMNFVKKDIRVLLILWHAVILRLFAGWFWCCVVYLILGGNISYDKRSFNIFIIVYPYFITFFSLCLSASLSSSISLSLSLYLYLSISISLSLSLYLYLSISIYISFPFQHIATNTQQLTYICGASGG